MKPTDLQIEMFEGHRPTAEPSPRLVLPFQRNEDIDVARTAKILGVSTRLIIDLIEDGLLPGAYRLVGTKSPYRILYTSVVEYCENLRVRYCIADHRPPLAKGRRRRDEDLLPFPLSDTMSVRECAQMLDCDPKSIVKLIDVGHLVGYQIRVETCGSPWRISRASLNRYVDNLHAMARRGMPSSPPPNLAR